jgi:hypothetical protein
MKAKAYKILAIFSLGVGMAQASQPIISFTPVTSTSFPIYNDSTQHVYYRVTNNSSSPHTFIPSALPAGVSQLTKGQGICGSPFKLNGGASCTLAYTVSGSQLAGSLVYQPKICQTAPDGTPSPYMCYQSSAINAMSVTLINSVAPVKLRISQTFIGLKVSGGVPVPRHFTIYNDTANPALGLTTTYLSSYPAGTTVSDCGDTISNNSSCTITVTPGPTPNAPAGSGTAAPTYFVLVGTNTNALTAGFEVLTYNNLYEGTSIFSIDDTTPDTGSIGGDGLDATSAPILQWSPTNDLVPGVSFTSTSSPTSCAGSTDGNCNTTLINNYYSTSPQNYAAGFCGAKTTGGYIDWYLPAICQLGYGDIIGTPYNCGTQQSPTAPNIHTAGLVIAEAAWSSTQVDAQTALYTTSNQYGSVLFIENKQGDAGIIAAYCARPFTNPTIE